MPQGDQALLQFGPLLKREVPLIRRPRLNERPIARKPVGQMTNGKRVGLRLIVAEDRTEVVEHEEGRPFYPLGHEELRLVAGSRKGLPADSNDPKPLPLAEGLVGPVAVAPGIEMLGQANLVAPCLAGAPMGHFQIARRRGERIGDRAPDIAAPVAVLVHGISRVGRRNELGVTHGARPRAVHGLVADIAVLQDLQRRNHLRPRELGLGAGAGQSRQRLNHVLVAGLGAVVRLHTPNGNEDVPVHAVFGLELIEQRLVLDELLLASRDPLGRDGAVDIFADGLLVFRLVVGGLDDLRIEGDVLGRLYERGAADPCPLGCRPEARHAILELVRAYRLRQRKRQYQHRGSAQDQGSRVSVDSHGHNLATGPGKTEAVNPANVNSGQFWAALSTWLTKALEG